MTTVKDVVDAMARIAPPVLAMDGDPIGLHAGDPVRRVKKLAVSLDAGRIAVAEAAAADVDMLVVHHPRFYRGLATLAPTDPAAIRALGIVQADLAVFSAHTNLDLAPGGTNDRLAAAAGIQDGETVLPVRQEGLLKLAVFVPAGQVEAVRHAVCNAGAGAIGQYSDCTFRSAGTGTYRCGNGTRPFLGRPGTFEEVEEYRLETVFGEWSRERIVAAMLAAHPYEEVAYDLYRLDRPGKQYGFGRVGPLPGALAVPELARRLARATGSTMTQYADPGGKKISRLAVWAGGGVDTQALTSCGAEGVVVGELGYHDLETFLDAGMAVVTLGHGFSEELVLEPLKKRLMEELSGVSCTVVGRGAMALKNVAMD